jgi:penicillin-binding protein 1A
MLRTNKAGRSQLMSTDGGKKPPLVADRRYPATDRKPDRKSKTKADKPRKHARQKAKSKPTRRRGPLGLIFAVFGWLFRLVLRLLWGIGWRIGAIAALCVAAAVLFFAATLPPITDLVDGRARGSVTLLDRYGTPFAWRGEQFGGMITADTVSTHLHNAVVATEDRRFYRHFGLSPRGIASAIRINLSEGRGPLSGHGGSTITQQAAKLLCLGVPYDPTEWESEAAYEADCRRTTLLRKGKEALFAMAMELKYSKEDILTIYLNRAYLGAGTRGFEAAAQRYFGISAAQTTPSQSAILAGLLKAPTTYAPTNNLQRSWDRANVVLGLMEREGYLTEEEAAFARENPAELSESAEEQSGGYFADWVMSEGPEFFTRNTTEDVIIRTTLDEEIQAAAEEALVWVFENRVSEGSGAEAAVVVMSADGAVRAMVGGRNLAASGLFNRATQASRQTGSSFKPFVYATALELGYSPLDLVDDSELTIDIPGSGPYTPRNYDNEFKGPITLTQAMAESRNIPAVRLTEELGRDNVRTIAEGFGITSDLADGPALALGASESTLIEMTGAYAGILNGGSSVTPYGLIDLRLQGDPTPMMDANGGIGERVIQERTARQLVWMMNRVSEDGTGQRARIPGWEIAAKTGTTQGARDAWFIGFTANYVAGVWMGYDDNTPLSGVTGSGLPAEIWRETMSRVLADTDPIPLPMDAPDAVSETLRGLQGSAATGSGGGDQGTNILINILNTLLNGG